MKILFTANRFPYPPYRGDKLKIYHLAKRLAQKHEVHLVTFLQDKNDLQYLSELQKIFTEIHLVPLTRLQSYTNTLFGFLYKEPFQVRYFHSRKMEAKIQELITLHDYDGVHVQHLRMAPYWEYYNDVPRILDLPDAFSLYWKRRIASSKGLSKIFNTIEQKRVFNYEKILDKYDLSLVCSREDQAYLQSERGIKNIEVLPNGVDVSTFSSEGHNYNPDKIILFTGNMDYAPNVDAVQYFVQDIFPLIRKEIPDVEFVIAGQRPVKKVLELAGNGVTVTGFVKNLQDMYAKASIVVAPLRFGAGTQNKVLEAMAMGVPIVSHNIGFNGLNIQSGEGVILAPEKEQFADECVALLRSASKRETIGKAGKEIIRTRYDWDVVAKKLEGYFLSIRKP
ncbi:glycosyltransferase [Taibaiella lutea]|uniref:Glycosyltransferase n=1 Tax=Taibaiella lutea TaxID=2608001 RepID=A0A5M6CHU8_9BACT|nr:glycosyltransferase [Taibaiella lutea]KAA5534798.1 glycosyltransferase [Taibaiella lutea]